MKLMKNGLPASAVELMALPITGIVIFRVCLPLDLCPQINARAWQDKNGAFKRKRIKNDIYSLCMILGKWRSDIERLKSKKIEQDTFEVMLRDKNSTHHSARCAMNCNKYQIPKRELKVVRHSSSRPDPGALMESVKLVTDQLVRIGLAWDDSSNWLEQTIPEWKQAKPKQGFVLVEIRDYELML